MGLLFRRRRERRAFKERTLAEVERVAPLVKEEARAIERQLKRTKRELAELPGAAAHCPRCGSRMTVGPVKDGRRYWTLWTCSSCGATYRPSDFSPASRYGGRRR